MRIRVEGPMVVSSTLLPNEIMERGLPRVLRALSKGTGRIKRGPGYPG